MFQLHQGWPMCYKDWTTTLRLNTRQKQIYIYTQTQHTYLAQQSTEAKLKCMSGRQNTGGMRKEKGARVSFTNKTIYLVYCKQLLQQRKRVFPRRKGERNRLPNSVKMDLTWHGSSILPPLLPQQTWEYSCGTVASLGSSIF